MSQGWVKGMCLKLWQCVTGLGEGNVFEAVAVCHRAG